MFQSEYEQRLLQLSIGRTPGREQLDIRCIPNRAGNHWQRNYTLKPDLDQAQSIDKDADSIEEMAHSTAYACLLRNEFLGSQISSTDDCKLSSKISREMGDFRMRENTRVYGFGGGYLPRLCGTRIALSTVSPYSQQLLSVPKRPKRKIARLPYKILDAPELQDDFYLNLIDWSSKNTLGVGLGCSVYLWNGNSGQVTCLCDFSYDDNPVTAVAWHGGGNQLAIGTLCGYVSIWDVNRQKQIVKLGGHSGRVAALAWRGNSLASGSQDHCILQRDLRTSPVEVTRCLRGHRREICGLQWSPSGQYLASGGNDSRIMVWTAHRPEPVYTFSEHKAAVKAVAWSPQKSGLLVSGGGAADRCLRFWNVLTGQQIQCIETGAQISNVAWGQNSPELVTTHGRGQDQIVVWRYPSLKQVVRLSGHTHRVNYLAVSPDGESIVTGGGDETLRFWGVFTKQPEPSIPSSVLSLYNNIR